MNKKALIACLSALLILALIVVGAVAVLYSGKKPAAEVSAEELFDKASSKSPLLCAVPSDAAMVMCGKSLKSVLPVLYDSTFLVG